MVPHPAVSPATANRATTSGANPERAGHPTSLLLMIADITLITICWTPHLGVWLRTGCGTKLRSSGSYSEAPRARSELNEESNRRGPVRAGRTSAADVAHDVLDAGV